MLIYSTPAQTLPRKLVLRDACGEVVLWSCCSFFHVTFVVITPGARCRCDYMLCLALCYIWYDIVYLYYIWYFRCWLTMMGCCCPHNHSLWCVQYTHTRKKMRIHIHNTQHIQYTYITLCPGVLPRTRCRPQAPTPWYVVCIMITVCVV